MLRNMFIGKPAGNYDRILDFSTAVTGNLFFVPSAEFLDDPPGPDGEDEQGVPATAQAPASTTADEGSLQIGSLKDVER
jgi:porphyrinogen peroxidase